MACRERRAALMLSPDMDPEHGAFRDRRAEAQQLDCVMAIRHVGCEQSQIVDLEFREIDHEISIKSGVGTQRDSDGRP